MSNDQANSQTLMARQPIFDRQLKVIAYQLLYRSDIEGETDFLDGEQASSEMLLNIYTSLSDEGTTKRVPAFVHLTREMLINQSAPQLLRKQIVIEVLEDSTIDQPLIDAVRKAKEDGFKLALDGFFFDAKYIPLLKLVDIVKLDVQQLSTQEVEEQIQKLAPYRITLLAQKIETLEQLYECIDQGFKLFQGHFLSKPQIVKGKKVAPNTLALMQVVQELQRPDTTAAAVERLIIKDPLLTFKLLRIVNSASYALVRKVESLSQAVVMLGMEQVRKWATLISLSSGSHKPSELSRSLLARGRMCELLAESMHYPNPSNFFMVGMMSDIGALLDMELDAVLEQIPLNDEIKAAIGKHEGTMGRILEAVLAYEHGEWERLDAFDIDDDLYESAYRQSLTWAQDAMQAMAEDA
ncbi:MAG: EAL and modified HD-GYP domain-containing signal transduction protein [Motiliproteus sp.]|jgi:EAL and modified HD-GYP domain-containing signal transduction protein